VLIDNAYKYAPTGSTITCALRESDQEIEFSVTSRGPKLERHERNRIFQPGYRAEAAKRRETGLGLGLALLRVCCEILNADWKVHQSASGDRSDSYETSFTVTFERSK
jgi:signal transduction histidine kinase